MKTEGGQTSPLGTLRPPGEARGWRSLPGDGRCVRQRDMYEELVKSTGHVAKRHGSEQRFELHETTEEAWQRTTTSQGEVG